MTEARRADAVSHTAPTIQSPQMGACVCLPSSETAGGRHTWTSRYAIWIALMAGFVNGPKATEWGQQRTQIEGVWPVVLVDLDLRYWADPKACEGRSRPSIRTLADTWGWKRSRVQRHLKTWDNGGTPPGQSRDSRGSAGQGSKPKKSKKRDTGGTLMGQSRDTGGTGPKETRARTSPSPSPSPSRNEPSADWTAAALFWASEVNPALGKRPAMPTFDSKLGKRLAGEIKRNGLDMVLDAFRWLAYGQTWHAQSQRARKTVDMWTPLRHVQKWAAYWRDIGDAPDDKKPNPATKPHQRTFAERFGAMGANDADPR